ncbi:MAG TPA: cysteine--tRNA ligase, partial [Candidatus Baltobacteraceae bacterium]|nr:cysteine--tRNA ligase [Candidatus Baltobacteraceae bacterium]
MPLRLYNTRTREVEAFAPLRDDRVRIYVCGLTPSAEAHLGHARSFLFFDVLRRYLVHLGYRVEYVQNVTDVDDRSIDAARALGRPWAEVVDAFYASFKASMNRLGVLEPDREPRATEFIAPILEMIERLVALGHAYVVGDGVYYAVRSFARYGALSGRNLDELRVGARIAPDEEKRDPLDFALWKFAKPGEPHWSSPWGEGRPGWHIECSAMSHVLLGEPFDIHGGGADLIFPHHENEIAQSEPLLPAPPMANVWMHCGLLQFDGRKMSKSLGNFEPLSDLLERHDPQAIRLLFLEAGYRKPINFTEESIDAKTAGLRRLFSAYDMLRSAPPREHDASTALKIVPYSQRFFAALDDDMNTAAATGVLFELAGAANEIRDAGIAAPAAAFLHEALVLLGLSPLERKHRPEPQTQSATLSSDGNFTIVAPADAENLLPGDVVARLQASVGNAVRFNGERKFDAVNRVIEARYHAKRAKDFA